MGGTVINADALQCYRDLAILTARPDAAAQARAPHRLYGFLDAAERGSAGSWRALALAEIAAAIAAESLPIVVGGTGLYLHALQHGLAPVSRNSRDDPRRGRGPASRARRRRVSRAAGGDSTRIRPRGSTAGDTQRLVRAYAVVRATGMPISAWRERAAWRGALSICHDPDDAAARSAVRRLRCTLCRDDRTRRFGRGRSVGRARPRSRACRR